MTLTKGIKKIIRYANAVYIYVPRLAYWVNLRSSESCKYLSEFLGKDNVSVNFDQAIKPYLRFLETIDMPSNNMLRSQCSNRRLDRVFTQHLLNSINEVMIKYCT